MYSKKFGPIIELYLTTSVVEAEFNEGLVIASDI